MKNYFSKSSLVRDSPKEPNQQDANKKEAPKQNKDEINWEGKSIKFQIKFPSNNSGGSGGAGGGGGNIDPPLGMNSNSFIGFVAGVLLVFGYAYYEGRYTEIKMRDFISDYLLQNRVDRIEVVNKRWARVVLDKSQRESVSKK